MGMTGRDERDEAERMFQAPFLEDEEAGRQADRESEEPRSEAEATEWGKPFVKAFTAIVPMIPWLTVRHNISVRKGVPC
jgi:hypothetical protein